MDTELLRLLCTTNGISGDENKIRDIILKEITPYATDIKVDNIGNIIVFKKGAEKANKKLMISAHMDEVGFIITDITNEGYLKFTTVGGIDKRVIYGKAVSVGENSINGVIGVKPVHLLDSKARNTSVDIDDMYIDIGAYSKENAEEYVSCGDSVSFAAPFIADENRVMAKAIDDRAGCFILINMIKSELPYDMYFTFVVQEEVGLRGAGCAAYTVNPDSAIIVEATTASDIPNIDVTKQVCELGEGAVISFMDKNTIYDKKYCNIALNTSKKTGVKVQLKKAVAGGNDAGIIHRSRGGIKTVAISVPCRYLHSAFTVINTDDLKATYETVKATAEEILKN